MALAKAKLKIRDPQRRNHLPRDQEPPSWGPSLTSSISSTTTSLLPGTGVLPAATRRGSVLPTGLGAGSHAGDLLQHQYVHPSSSSLQPAQKARVERAQPGRGLSHAQPLITCQDNRRVIPWFLNTEQYTWCLSCLSACPFG